MAEITPQRAGEMVHGLFVILAGEPDGLQSKEALARLAKAVPPTTFEAANYEKHPGIRRYEHLVRFHTINSVKAGWMTKVDGVWALTEAGRAALKEYPDPEALYRESVRLYRAWRKTQPKSETVIVDQPVPPDELLDVLPVDAVELIDESLAFPAEVRDHSEIEGVLLELGSAMGLQLWVDRTDRGRTHNGRHLGDIPGVVNALPMQFNPEMTKRIERIDVLWLRDDAIIAAFEVEATTAVYSGLLRMADLLALSPNLNIPLYLVAPEGKRGKVREEISRPTFSRALKKPLARNCRYISFDRLRADAARLGPW